jgi:hypothetical protein
MTFVIFYIFFFFNKNDTNLGGDQILDSWYLSDIIRLCT